MKIKEQGINAYILLRTYYYNLWDFLNFVLFNIMRKNNSKYIFSRTFWLSNFFRAIRKYFQEVLSSKLVIVFYIKQWWLLEKAEDMDGDINFQVEKKVQSLSIFVILPIFTTNKDIHIKKLFLTHIRGSSLFLLQSKETVSRSFKVTCESI